LTDEPEYREFREYHYYLAGRGCGVLAWVVVLMLVAKVAQLGSWGSL